MRASITEVALGETGTDLGTGLGTFETLGAPE